MTEQLTLSVPPHHNQRLFSDHYLDAILPSHPAWQMLAAEAGPVMQEISSILNHFTPSTNEAQTEFDVVRPILALLGHTFEVQPQLATPHGTKRPDYVLYANQAAVDANKNAVLDDWKLGAALMVGEAKHWDRPLDVSVKGKVDPLDNRAPSFQIAFYMQHSGLAWGLLTNGRLWRLYHRDTAHKLDHYYEVDLPSLIASGDPLRFIYFYGFFSRRAFVAPDLGLDAILKASADYAHGVGESLKEQVYDALRYVAQGFFDYPGNKLEPSPESLKAIYDNSLIILYRLLFIFYAEARELLPVRQSDVYREEYSLRAIARKGAQKIDHGLAMLPGTTITWNRLRTLFKLIDEGSPPLKIGTFDGGLFDPKRHDFLERHAVGDAHLDRAIERLARVDSQFIDYRDLAERHLGAIYEGLLEFHLVPTAEEGEWTIALVNDKGERKITGSYYTPDYIVKYMVEQALAPVLQAAIDGKTTDDEKSRAILAVKVCDPAMGSGHFLVEAAEHVARFLVDQGIPASGESGTDLEHWKRRVAQNCLYGVDVNPLAVDLAKLSLWLATASKDRPLSFLDHHLRSGNTIVGTWVANLRPQSKPSGASKKSKTIAEQTAAGQLSMLDDDAFRQSMSTAVSSMWLIEERPGDTVAGVKEQEAIYEDLRHVLAEKYESLANLVAATHFGVVVDPSLMKPLADFATNSSLFPLSKFKDWLDQARTLAVQHRFFHWELEFPEVFFDRHGQPLGERAGFDAVVGNPPYVRQELVSPLKPYLRAEYASFDSIADLYIYFYERGLRLLRQGGRLAYISSGTFARANFAKPFRRFLPSVGHLEILIDFGENQPFPEAEMVRPSIVVLVKGTSDAPFRSLLIDGKIPSSLEMAVAQSGVDCDPTALDLPEWTFREADETRLLKKLIVGGRPLGEVAAGRIFRGVLSGLTEAFVIDPATRLRLMEEDPACQRLIKRFLQGQDLRPWYQEDEGRWLILLPDGWTRSMFEDVDTEEEAWNQFSNEFPSLAGHLMRFSKSARIRQDQGQFWWELRACDYYAEFAKPKIFWPDISKLPRFSWDESGIFIGNTGHFVADASPALLGILQSRAIWFVISQICQPLRLRAGLWQYRLFRQFMERLPIPELTAGQENAVGDLARQITTLAGERYALHQKARHRIADLARPGALLNLKLSQWWTLDFATFRVEAKKAFGGDIPLNERDDWETWVAEQRAKHDELTAAIISREKDVNEQVYAAFDLDAAEIALIERSTKYRYGEV